MANLRYDDFLADAKTQYAVVMCLSRIGEAASRIEIRFPAFVAQHRDWPWQHMRAMRNRGAHDYESI